MHMFWIDYFMGFLGSFLGEKAKRFIIIKRKDSDAGEAGTY